MFKALEILGSGGVVIEGIGIVDYRYETREVSLRGGFFIETRWEEPLPGAGRMVRPKWSTVQQRTNPRLTEEGESFFVHHPGKKVRFVARAVNGPRGHTVSVRIAFPEDAA